MNGNFESLVASMDKLSSTESSPNSNQSTNDLFNNQDKAVKDDETINNSHNNNNNVQVDFSAAADFIKIDPKNPLSTTTTINNDDIDISSINNHHNNQKQNISHHHSHQEWNSNHHHHHQDHHLSSRQNDHHHFHHHHHHHQQQQQQHQNYKSNMINHHNHQQYPPQPSSISLQPNNQQQQQEKKYKSYKLVSDPALKKGAPKLYRYDGIVSSKELAIIVKDPRQHVSTLHWTLREPVDLIIPRFKIDKNYVGTPPSIEVSITNLNDNINKSFLIDIIKKFDAMEEIEIFYHPKTKKHLGLAKIIFMTPSGANACVNKLNQTSLMGNIINVFFDPFAKKINQIYESIVNPQPIADNTFIDPNFIDPTTKSRLTKTSDYSSGYDVSNEFNSTTFSTPSTFDNQTFYSSSSAAANQLDSTTTPSSTTTTTSNWKQINLNDSTNSDSGNKSPVRESLEKRINNLLRKNCVGMVGSFFPDVAKDSNFSPLPVVLNNHEHTFHRRSLQKQMDDSEAILGTPPSPFVSASEYLKWHQITKEIDNKNQNNSDSSNHSDKKRNSQDMDNNKNNENNVDNDDDDDDRMSLSSLSSGDNKLQDNSVINNHQQSINYNDLSTMMATWNSSTATTDAYNSLTTNAMYPQFMYHSFTAQPSFSFFNSFMPTSIPTMPPVFDLNDIRSRIAKSSEDILKELLDDTLKTSIKDLKEILRKDIYKKIVENFSFKMFDQWWEESERKYHSSTDNNRENKHNEQQRPSSPVKIHSEIHLPFLTNPIFENSIQNRHRHQINNSSNFEYGVSRGLRAAMGKMPSFKRKIIKPKSPVDEKLSDISDEDDDIDDRRNIRRRPHKRIPHRRRHLSDSSESLPSRHHRRHHSDKSQSSSESSGSSSHSSSSSSSDSSSSSESSSDSESGSSSSRSSRSSTSSSSSSTASSSSSSSESSSSSSSESSSQEESDEDNESVSVSASVSGDEESGSETDALSSKAVSVAASVSSSIISKKSHTTIEKDEIETKQITVPTRDVIEKSPKYKNVKNVDDDDDEDVSDSDSSRTCSADETKKYEEELQQQDRLADVNRMNSFDELKNSKTREEFEASEALISLAESWFEQSSNDDYKQQSHHHQLQFTTDSRLLKPLSLNDLIQMEHNYSIRILESPLQSPTQTSSMVNGKRKRQSKKGATTTEPKRKRKKDEIITDENVTPSVLAVASEWRKTKRKSVKQPELVSSENLMQIDVNNKLLNDEIKTTTTPEQPPITFPMRDVKTEEAIIFEFLNVGLELEDINYLKRRYHQLLEEDNSNLPWLNDIHWVDHPATCWQPAKKKRKDNDNVVRIHETGCARSEGYYKLDRTEKMHHIANIPIASNEMEDTNRPKQIVTTQQLTREARNQRRLYNLVEQQVSSYHTDLLKLNQLKFRKKQVKFARSKIHVWGLFAMQPIPPDEMVIEYIGQRIRPMVAEIREKKYLNAGSSYLFKIDSDTIIDATHCGNVARFINHSCNPNCYAKVITVEGQKRIVIYSKQTIEVGQEITYDYKFPIEDDNKIPCLCRSVGCRGYLN